MRWRSVRHAVWHFLWKRSTAVGTDVRTITGKRVDQVDRWFRGLDQKRIGNGLREWVVQVTGIHVDGNNVWIQIADVDNIGGSILLHVSTTTSVQRALRALTMQKKVTTLAYPQIITATESRAESLRVPLAFSR